MDKITLNFDKMDGLVPAIIQDIDTQKVLMLGFMNEKPTKGRGRQAG